MFPTDIKSWLFYVVVALVLGALGSGLWDIAFRPIFTKAARVLLQILTLGLVSSRNKIYLDISRRFVYKPFLFFLFLILLAFCGLSGNYLAAVSDSDAGADTTITTNEFSSKSAEEQKAILEQQKAILADLKTKIQDAEFKMNVCFLLISIWGLIATLYVWIRGAYVISAIGYYEQCLNICLPYITDMQQREIVSKFSQIATKEQYQAVIGNLKQIADAEKISLPMFSMF